MPGMGLIPLVDPERPDDSSGPTSTEEASQVEKRDGQPQNIGLGRGFVTSKSCGVRCIPLCLQGATRANPGCQVNSCSRLCSRGSKQHFCAANRARFSEPKNYRTLPLASTRAMAAIRYRTDLKVEASNFIFVIAHAPALDPIGSAHRSLTPLMAVGKTELASRFCHSLTIQPRSRDDNAAFLS